MRASRLGGQKRNQVSFARPGIAEAGEKGTKEGDSPSLDQELAQPGLRLLSLLPFALECDDNQLLRRRKVHLQEELPRRLDGDASDDGVGVLGKER